MRLIRYIIEKQHEGITIEQFLRFRMGISRRVVVALKKPADGILLNGSHARTIDKIKEGDSLELRLPQPEKDIRPSDIEVETLYEDKDIIVYNKPSGMPCHRSPSHYTDTLENVYAKNCERTGEITPFRPLNRLDKDTSGAIVCAKNQIAAGKLWKNVNKEYIAVAQGLVEKDHDIIDLPIDREQPMEMLRIVTPDGQRAVTEYRVLQRCAEYTLLSFLLHTGRTHQIRVHMSHIGHPLAGDGLYGGGSTYIERQALHCAQVSFNHPITGQSITVCADLQNDMKKLLEKLGFAYNLHKN